MNLSELEVEPVAREREGEFFEWMDRHHYLGAPCKIGESAFYAAVLQGRWVALSSFNGAALKSRARDEWLGWHPRDRDARRHLILNQSRFLVLEPIANLASRALSLFARRVARDWPGRYGHPLLLLETFVDPERFRGGCYLADNWVEIGRTAGYRRVCGGYRSGSTPKMMWVRPLRRDARRKLAGAHLSPRFFPNNQIRKMHDPDDYKTMIDYFEPIEDPRSGHGRRYRLSSLLALCGAAVLAGAKGYLEIGQWVQAQSDKVLRHFRVDTRRGRIQRPSVYCLRNALIRTDPAQFDAALNAWHRSIDGTDAAIAIDGKTLRGAIDGNGRRIHLLSAVGHRSRHTLVKKKPS